MYYGKRDFDADREKNILAGRKCGMDGFVFIIDWFPELERELYGKCGLPGY